MTRPRTELLRASLLVALIAGCTGPWKKALTKYEKMTPIKALALARDPKLPDAFSPRWAAGYSSNASTEGEAIDQAMSQCRAARVQYGVNATCELYAIGEQVVYGSRYELPHAPAPSAPVAEPEPPTSGPQVAEGTCFAVRSDGVLVTAYHVVEGATSIQVALADGRQLPATVETVSPTLDLAVLRVAASTPEYLVLAENRPASLGDSVFTIGFPVRSLLGDEPKYSSGEISSLSGPHDDATYLQVTVPIQPGNSGGPLVSSQAEVLGIVTLIAAPLPFIEATGSLPQNINWAVRGELVRTLVNPGPQTRPAQTKEEADQAENSGRCMRCYCTGGFELMGLGLVRHQVLGDREVDALSPAAALAGSSDGEESD